jgi:hypothetical protein
MNKNTSPPPIFHFSKFGCQLLDQIPQASHRTDQDEKQVGKKISRKI